MKRMLVHDAKGRDGYIDYLAHRDALAAQMPGVLRGKHRQFSADEIRAGQTIDERASCQVAFYRYYCYII